ncbi:hypothetical protein [Chryseobacterium sp.]|uniref:hypothetical protein n=1 Tax=Chryseobacterium sp. TaxID=1871047 RepID=UPI0024E21EFA|nr:hypothetical protein [Chryseobacterium sp.]
MKEFLQNILKSTEDRIKNPFVGTFITSWIIFNWKPIIFIVFSDKGIEDKIKLISENYNDIWCYLWLPLISAIFYMAILPYISFVFEYFTKFSHGLRNQVNLEARNAALELQIGVARNEIKLEEEKTTFRERNSHNLMVERLQEQNKALEEANKKHLDTVSELQKQGEYNAKELREIITNYSSEVEDLNRKLNEETANTLQMRIQYDEMKNANNANFNDVSKLKYQLNVMEFINRRLKNPVDKVINVNNYSIFEYFNAVNEIVYYGIQDGKRLSHENVYSILSDNNYGEFSDSANVAEYKARLLNILSKDQKHEILDK